MMKSCVMLLAAALFAGDGRMEQSQLHIVGGPFRNWYGHYERFCGGGNSLGQNVEV